MAGASYTQLANGLIGTPIAVEDTRGGFVARAEDGSAAWGVTPVQALHRFEEVLNERAAYRRRRAAHEHETPGQAR